MTVRIIVRILLSIVVLFVASRYFVSKTPTNKSGIVSSLLQEDSPTPFPFQELTVPYLRSYSYDSKLGALEKVGGNALYTSYLTSYTSDALRVDGLLTKPKGEMPADGWPAIVFIHGYIPPAQYQTQGQYAAYVDYLAKQGFVIFKIDLRGHASSEGEAGGGYFGSDYVRDALNAHTALTASEFINPKKVGLWGHSMAGNIVMRSLVARPTIPAVVVWAGAVYTYADQQKYGIQDGSYRPPAISTLRQGQRQRIRDMYGDFSAASPFWQQVAVTNYLKDIKGAVELHHAIDDPVVNVGYSRDLIKLLDDTAVAHELKEYPSGGHNFTGVSFTEAMQNTVLFFRAHL
jgi:dipeptidyl aminopeptidase/acylaminoacyl peptidase